MLHLCIGCHVIIKKNLYQSEQGEGKNGVRAIFRGIAKFTHKGVLEREYCQGTELEELNKRGVFTQQDQSLDQLKQWKLIMDTEQKVNGVTMKLPKIYYARWTLDLNKGLQYPIYPSGAITAMSVQGMTLDNPITIINMDHFIYHDFPLDDTKGLWYMIFTRVRNLKSIRLLNLDKKEPNQILKLFNNQDENKLKWEKSHKIRAAEIFDLYQIKYMDTVSLYNHFNDIYQQDNVDQNLIRDRYINHTAKIRNNIMNLLKLILNMFDQGIRNNRPEIENILTNTRTLIENLKGKCSPKCYILLSCNIFKAN